MFRAGKQGPNGQMVGLTDDLRGGVLGPCGPMPPAPSLSISEDVGSSIQGVIQDLQGFLPCVCSGTGEMHVIIALTHLCTVPAMSLPVTSKELYVNKEAFWTSNSYAHDQSLTLGGTGTISLIVTA